MKPFWMSQKAWDEHLDHMDEIRERAAEMREDFAEKVAELRELTVTNDDQEG